MTGTPDLWLWWTDYRGLPEEPYTEMLLPEQRDALSALSHPKRRREFIFSRCLYNALARRLGFQPLGAFPPHSPHPPMQRPGETCYTSMTHSGGFAAVAASLGCPVSVDMELMKKRDFGRLVHELFPDKYSVFLKEGGKCEFFYALWCEKECAYKWPGGSSGISYWHKTVPAGQARLHFCLSFLQKGASLRFRQVLPDGAGLGR